MRDQDFGGTWHGDCSHNLQALLYDHNAIEDRFMNRGLEARRADPFSAADALLGAGIDELWVPAEELAAGGWRRVAKNSAAGASPTTHDAPAPAVR